MSEALSKVHGDGEIGAKDNFDPWRRFCVRLPHMIQEAQARRTEALAQSRSAKKYKPNYRDFYVGTSLFAVDVEWRGELEYSAHNTMPSRWGPRVCAEKRVVERLEKQYGVNWLPVGIVIIGEPQEDRATGNAPESLWACGETCLQDVLPKLPDDTLALTLRPDLRKGQIQTNGEMQTFYYEYIQGEDPIEPPLFHRRKDGWHEIVDRYDTIIPQGTDVLASAESRSQAVEAVRMAIQMPTLRVA